MTTLDTVVMLVLIAGLLVISWHQGRKAGRR